MIKLIGTYNLGFRKIKLFANTANSDGQVLIRDHTMYVGVSNPKWSCVLEVLMHESFEAAMMDMHCRYLPSADQSIASDTFLFVMTHSQFGQVTAQASDFIAAAFPDLAKYYSKLKRDKDGNVIERVKNSSLKD